MGTVTAKTKVKVEGQPDVEKNASVEYDIPSDLEGLRAKFGDEVVASNAEGAIVISLQSFMRRHIDKTPEELQALVNGWKPDTRAAVVRKSAFEKASEAIGGLTAEQRKELIAKLKAQA